MLGIEITRTTVAKYVVPCRKPPSETCRTFLDNLSEDLASIDLFTVLTATFRILYVLLVLRHERRRIVHFNITEHPTGHWMAQRMVEAFPWYEAPRYLLRDRGNVYDTGFRRRVHSLGIEAVLAAPRSAWQIPYVERLIGSVRRDCLNHVIVWNERQVESPDCGKVVAFPHVGGLHHEYRRAA